MIPRGLIGVVHLPALPGDPLAGDGTSWNSVETFARTEAAALAHGGADALLVENFGSTPFVKGTAGARIPPHQVAFLAVLVRELRHHELPIGVNCLRNDAHSALGIAAASGADFIRINVHTGAYVTDQGIIEGEAHATLRYRKELGAENVALLADVLVKHAAPLVPLSPEDATRDCVHRGLADAIIVTGEATGAPVSPPLLERVATAAAPAPVLIGSGLTPNNAESLVPLAQGAIVGTWLKHDGDVRAPVDQARVETLAQLVRDRWRRA